MDYQPLPSDSHQLWSGWRWIEDVVSVFFALVLAFELESFQQGLDFVFGAPYHILESFLCICSIVANLQTVVFQSLPTVKVRGLTAEVVVSMLTMTTAIACGIDLWILTPFAMGGNLKYSMLLNCLMLDQMSQLFGGNLSMKIRLGVTVTVKSLGLFLAIGVPIVIAGSIFATRFIGKAPALVDITTDEGQHNSELFGTVPQSLLTLFQVATLDFGDIVRPSIYSEPWLAVFWILFVIYMSIGMMNLSLAFMSNAFDQDVVLKSEEAQHMRKETQLNMLILNLDRDCGDGDLCDFGFIIQKLASSTDPALAALLKDLGIKSEIFLEILRDKHRRWGTNVDMDHDPMISLAELAKLAGEAVAQSQDDLRWAVAKLDRQMQDMNHRQDKLMKHMVKRLDELAQSQPQGQQ